MIFSSKLKIYLRSVRFLKFCLPKGYFFEFLAIKEINIQKESFCLHCVQKMSI